MPMGQVDFDNRFDAAHCCFVVKSRADSARTLRKCVMT